MIKRSGLSLVFIAATLIVITLLLSRFDDAKSGSVRIGVLHSLTGTMAVNEKPLVEAVRMAVEEINAQGGLSGRPVAMIVADGRSDPETFAREAERLIEKEKVSVLFGCWTSVCRKAVKPVVEQYRHLLFYPVQYEGMELSPNILYTGMAPNQQIVPGVRWAMETFGKRVYLLGSDYIFPRVANLIIADLVKVYGGEILGEHYLPLAATEITGIVEDIALTKPDIVFNTLNGDSNGAFFSAMVQAGLADLPLMSFSVDENGMKTWEGGRLSKHYGVWSYFQSLEGLENARFVHAFRSRFGQDRVLGDPMEAAYSGVLLWAQAVKEVGSALPGRVSPALLRQSIKSPSGISAVDAGSRHLWKIVRVGKVGTDGQFAQVFASSAALRPTPWPVYRSREAWRFLLTEDLR